MRDLIPFELNVQKSIPANPEPVILVVPTYLASLPFEIKIIPLAADDELQLRNDNRLRDIAILLKFCLVARKMSGHAAHFRFSPNRIIADLYLPPCQAGQEKPPAPNSSSQPVSVVRLSSWPP